MAALKPEIKAFIVQSVACFDAPSQVVESVLKEFGIHITRQQVEQNDPTKVSGRGLAKKWVDLFHSTRARFQSDISDIPIANKAYRLRVLDRMTTKAEGMRNMALAATLIEQAAKECGDAYSNKHKFEHSGPNGGAVEVMNYTPEHYAAAKKAIEGKLTGLD